MSEQPPIEYPPLCKNALMILDIISKVSNTKNISKVDLHSSYENIPESEFNSLIDKFVEFKTFTVGDDRLSISEEFKTTKINNREELDKNILIHFNVYPLLPIEYPCEVFLYSIGQGYYPIYVYNK